MAENEGLYVRPQVFRYDARCHQPVHNSALLRDNRFEAPMYHICYDTGVRLYATYELELGATVVRPANTYDLYNIHREFNASVQGSISLILLGI